MGRERVMLNSKTMSGGLLILAMLAAAACDQTKRYTDQEYVQKAKAFQDEGKPESALIELKNALKTNPKNPEARLRLAEIYVSRGLGELMLMNADMSARARFQASEAALQ